MIESLGITFEAICELAVLASVGFFLVRKKIVSDAGLETLSRLVIGLFLPLLMFTQIIGGFTFRNLPDWWTFPLLSVALTVLGYGLGLLFLRANPSFSSQSGAFLGISTFQNSGYLPLPLVAGLLSPDQASEMFIYIFLFLLGFNMTIFSFGIFVLDGRKTECRFDYKDMFNAPVMATLAALAVVALRLQAWIPPIVSKPADLLGRCAIPLSIFVVGGNLAMIPLHSVRHVRPLVSGLVLKLLVLPAVVLILLFLFKPRPLVGFLLLLQACMPPAALLSVIAKNEKLEDELINQAIFYGHLLCIVTIPLFLGLYRLF